MKEIQPKIEYEETINACTCFCHFCISFLYIFYIVYIFTLNKIVIFANIHNAFNCHYILDLVSSRSLICLCKAMFQWFQNFSSVFKTPSIELVSSMALLGLSESFTPSILSSESFSTSSTRKICINVENKY